MRTCVLTPTSKHLDSISCWHRREFTKMPNAEAFTKVRASLRDDREVDRLIVGLRSDGTCPWNPVLSISFVWSIQHDRPFPPRSFICFINANMKHITLSRFITLTSSIWLQLSTCPDKLHDFIWIVWFMHLIKICLFRCEPEGRVFTKRESSQRPSLLSSSSSRSCSSSWLNPYWVKDHQPKHKPSPHLQTERLTLAAKCNLCIFHIWIPVFHDSCVTYDT